MAPTLPLAFFVDLVEAMLHPFAILIASRELQALEDFVLPIRESLAMLQCR
jgi:hypothetical protein